jgi:hypothetical protein
VVIDPRITLSFELGAAVLDLAKFREDFSSRAGEAHDHGVTFRRLTRSK